MAKTSSRVTIHMVASLDGFIARRDGRVDWLETSDKFEGGETMAPEFVEEFLKTIDCYVMGSRTYETALDIRGQGVRLVLRRQANLHPHQSRASEDQGYRRALLGDLARLVNERLKPAFRSIWFVGGGAVSGECLRLGLADEVRYSIMPILIGDGISFFEGLDKDIALHLVEVKAYESATVALRYEVRK